MMENEKRLIDANTLKITLCKKEGAEALGHSTVKLARISAIVDAQPTVDAVEVVHGRWIETVWNERSIQKDCYGTPVPQYICSVCAREEMIKEPYCHCGAKMDLEVK